MFHLTGFQFPAFFRSKQYIDHFQMPQMRHDRPNFSQTLQNYIGINLIGLSRTYQQPAHGHRSIQHKTAHFCPARLNPARVSAETGCLLAVKIVSITARASA